MTQHMQIRSLQRHVIIYVWHLHKGYGIHAILK